MTAMDDADAAAAKAVPFVNRDARRRILEAAAPYIAAAERERIRQRLGGLVVNGSDGPVRVADLIGDPHAT